MFIICSYSYIHMFICSYGWYACKLRVVIVLTGAKSKKGDNISTNDLASYLSFLPACYHLFFKLMSCSTFYAIIYFLPAVCG